MMIFTDVVLFMEADMMCSQENTNEMPEPYLFDPQTPDSDQQEPQLPK